MCSNNDNRHEELVHTMTINMVIMDQRQECERSYKCELGLCNNNCFCSIVGKAARMNDLVSQR